jgi:hypothetical protein
VLGPFGISRSPNAVRKELRNIVETYVFVCFGLF